MYYKALNSPKRSDFLKREGERNKQNKSPFMRIKVFK